MQTKTYAELFALIQALCGVVFASIETPRIKALINRRALRAYRSSNYWTRFLKIGEQRFVSGPPIPVTNTVVGESYYIDTVGNTDYNQIGVPFSALLDGEFTGDILTVSSISQGSISVGDFITDANLISNVQIIALGSGSGGVGTYVVSPSQALTGSFTLATFTVGTYFTSTGVGSGNGTVRKALGYVPYSENGKSNIDTFLRVYKQAPYIASSVQEYDIMVTSAGATLVCGDLNPSEAYVTYKAQLVDTYGDGSGEVSAIPAEWYQYIAHGTYADYLRAEGQQEKSVIADQEAEMLLQDELIRLDENHTSGLVSSRIFTNANMQMRY